MSENSSYKDRPLIFKELTHKIIGAALEVYKTLDTGSLMGSMKRLSSRN